MGDRCGFTVSVPERERRLSRRLRERFPEIFDGFEPTAFDDLPTDEAGVWRCPRTADAGGRCVLHAAESDEGATLEAIADALAGDVEPDAFHPDADVDVETASRRFVGVDLAELDLRRCRPEATGTGPIDLRCADVGRLRLDGATLSRPLRLEDASVGWLSATELSTDRPLRLRHATVRGGIEARTATIGGRLDCRFARIGGDVALDGATADGRFDFGFAEVDGAITAEKSACGGRFTLKEATVGRVDAERVEVSGPDPDSDIPGLQFRGLETAGDVVIADCRCDGQLLGYKMEIGGDVDASGARVEAGVSLGAADGTNLPEAAVDGSLDFRDARVGGEFTMLGREAYGTDPTVGGKLDVSGATIDRLELTPALTHDSVRVVDCRGSTIRSGRLGQPADAEPVCYDLTEAVLGTVALECDSGSVADRVLCNRTTFDGFTFERAERADFERAGWRLHEFTPRQRRDVAFVRAFGEASEYARDVRAICLERPAVRKRLLAGEPPYDVDALARALFEPEGGDALEEPTIGRIARNGPETADQLGPELFRRERYRYGVVTLLARELRGRETPMRELFADAGGAVRRLAAAADASTPAAPDGGAAPGAIEERPSKDRSSTAPTGAGSGADDGDLERATLAVRDRFAAVLADPDSVAPTLTDRELTYLAARKGADDVGDSTAAANFFVNELRARRALHRRRAREAGSVAEAAAYRWKAGTNALFDLIAGYGERPGRAVGASVATVGAFALVYWALWHLSPAFSSSTYGGLSGGVLLSLDAFTALVLGGVEVTSRTVRFVAALEAFLGAFLIALFVFTLTRSLHR